MKIGSLFSGIGGLELGLEAALGGHTVWQVEQNEYCRTVLAKHWPDADRSVIDVRKANSSNLAPVDLVCGGSPCQDISLAGKGAGLAGGRSGLWFEYLRLVRELEPRWVVIENVAALRLRGLDAVLWGLADAGYDAEWATFGAVDVGAPHRRKRLVVLAHASELDQPNEPGGDDPEALGRTRPRAGGRIESGRSPPGAGQRVAAEQHGEADSGRQQGGRVRGLQQGVGETQRDDPDRCGGAASVGDTDEQGLEERARVGGDTRSQRPAALRASRQGATQWQAEPPLGRVVDGLPRDMDRVERLRRTRVRVARLQALGNAVVPQWSYQVGLRIKQLRGAR